MTTTFIKEVSPKHLDVAKWGNFSFVSNGETLIITSSNIKYIAERAWLYENENVLIFNQDKYQLLTKSGSPSHQLMDISKTIINDKYRVTTDTLPYGGEMRRTICVIYEETGGVVFKATRRWKDIIDVRGDFLIVKTNDDKICLTKIPSIPDAWEELFKGLTVEFVSWPVFKLLNFHGKWELYNVRKQLKNPDYFRYNDIQSFNNGQLFIAESEDGYDLFNAEANWIFSTSVKKYDVDNEKINVRGYIYGSGLDEDIVYDAVYNFSGKLLSYAKYEESVQEQSEVVEVPPVEDTTLIINKINIVPVGDEIEKKFVQSTSNSINVPVEEDNTKVAWLLLSTNQLVILEYLSSGSRGQKKKRVLEEQVNEQFSTWLKNNVKNFRSLDCEMEYNMVKIEEFINDNIRNNEALIDDEVTMRSDTNEAMLLVDNYRHFQSLINDEDRIFDAIIAMHPSLESLLDLTNIRIDDEDLYNIPQKCIETNDEIKEKEEELIRLAQKQQEIEKDILQLKKTLTQQEKERKLLHKLIVKEILEKFGSSQRVDTDHTETLTNVSPQFVSLTIGGVKYHWQLNDQIEYKVFNNRKVYGKANVKYVLIGNNIMVFINPDVAEDIVNTRKDSLFELIGQGESKRENQVFGFNENTKVRDHRRGMMRIFIFVREQNDTCRLFDQVEYVSHQEKWDGNRSIILFKFKSLLKFQ